MNSIKRSINNTQNRIRNITKSLSEKTSSKYNNKNNKNNTNSNNSNSSSNFKSSSVVSNNQMLDVVNTDKNGQVSSFNWVYLIFGLLILAIVGVSVYLILKYLTNKIDSNKKEITKIEKTEEKIIKILSKSKEEQEEQEEEEQTEGKKVKKTQNKKAHYDYVWDNKLNNYKKVRHVEQVPENNRLRISGGYIELDNASNLINHIHEEEEGSWKHSDNHHANNNCRYPFHDKNCKCLYNDGSDDLFCGFKDKKGTQFGCDDDCCETKCSDYKKKK